MRLSKLRKKRSRGSTLLEVMVAGALLPIGMSALLILLLRTSLLTRDTSLDLQAVQFGDGLVQEYEALGYNGLTPQTVTGLSPPSGDSRIKGKIEVTQSNTGSNPFFTIKSTVTWTDSNGQDHNRDFTGTVPQ